MKPQSDVVPAVLTDAARRAVAALRAAFLLQWGVPEGGQPVVSLIVAITPTGPREELIATFDPQAEGEEVRSEIPARAFPGYARIGVDHTSGAGFTPCDPVTGAALSAEALRHARALADRPVVDFVLTPAARARIDTLRAQWETAMPDDPPGLPFVSWKLIRTRDAALLGSAAVGFYAARETPGLEAFVQRAGDLDLIYEPWETQARPNGLMVIDYRAGQGFFLRDPATGMAYPSPPPSVPTELL